MFVGEHRHGSLIATKDIHHLFHQLVAWVEFLAFFVPRIVTVFADNQDGIDRQLVSAQAERFANRWIDLELMLLGQSSTQVIRGYLVGIHRNHLRSRYGLDVVGCIALEQAAHNH